MNTIKKIDRIYPGIPASDGDGVKLTRLIGMPQLKQLDPFLLLDVFGTDKAQDYIGGFPPHPHRGFETVTYMMAGRMRHKDSMGNEGVIGPGDVQWMSAASGIIHSEMPEQEDGLLAGFQLWVNLSQKDKMSPPRYQELADNDIPVETHDNGVTIKVITGRTEQTNGAVDHTWRQTVTDNEINYWDVFIPKGQSISEQIPASHNGFIYVIDGSIKVGTDATTLKSKQLGTLLFEAQNNDEQESTYTSKFEAKATEDTRFLLVTGEPLNEPVVRAGPFVMATHKDLKQAFKDYESGQLVQ